MQASSGQPKALRILERNNLIGRESDPKDLHNRRCNLTEHGEVVASEFRALAGRICHISLFCGDPGNQISLGNALLLIGNTLARADTDNYKVGGRDPIDEIPRILPFFPMLEPESK
jgi:hypothetical protein